MLASVAGGLFWPLHAGENPARRGAEVETFLAQHWRHPLPAQGKPPAQFTALDASLDPDSCKQCHASQWQDWQGSLHSRSMGAGIQWQLRQMSDEESGVCLRCHAPLAEQQALVASDNAGVNTSAAPRPSYVPAKLHQQGLVCAACHVRGHERFGPPPRSAARDSRSHGGFKAHPAFEDSRFCATCHQFPENGFRLAGKLVEDTYNQWRASRFVDSQSCQACHMPDRRHLFRGIHDREMVRKAVDVQLKLVPANGNMVAQVTVRNVGAGHHFPTYMVPKVEVNLDLHEGGRSTRLDTHVFGWRADLGLTQEEFDTRIPAGGVVTYAVVFVPPKRDDWHVELGLQVAPREHYERLFQSELDQATEMDATTRALLQHALREAQATHYEALRLRASPDHR